MVSHLCQTLNDFWPDLNVTENDFKNPTTSLLKSIYEKFFEECALSESMLETSPNDRVLNPSFIKESLPLISTSVFLRNIFSWMKGPQFGIDDIIEPGKKRSIKHIEMLTNFLAYVDCFAGPHSNQVMAETDDKVLKKDELLTEIDKFKEKLNECALIKANQSSKLKLAEEEASEFRSFLDSMNKVNEEKDAEYNVIQATLSEEKAESNAMEQAIQKEMAEIQALREKVVSSPDTVSRQKVELIYMKNEAEANHMQLLKLAKEKQRVDTDLDELITVIQPRLTQVEDLSIKITFSRNLEKGLVTDEETLKNAKDRVSAATEDMNVTRQQLAHTENEEKEVNARHKDIRSSMAKTYQQVLEKMAEAEENQLKLGANQVLAAQEIYRMKQTIMSIDDDRKDYGNFILEQDKIFDETLNGYQDHLEILPLAMKDKLKKYSCC